jgi:oligopeptide/dipeptide ABC transporter ATP-binding protein
MALLEVSHLSVTYKQQKSAVDDVCLSLEAGATLGIIGESGCGKTSLAKAICRLVPVDSGEIFYEGKEILGMRDREFRKFCRNIQLVFQDTDSALNPKKKVASILREALLVHKIAKKSQAEQEVDRLMRAVKLPLECKQKYPYELSGGMRQRVGIARALAVRPRLLICDEPVSALDVCIQAQIIDLLKELRQDLELSIILIAHGLSAVRTLADHIGVMYLGRIVEYGPIEEVFANPLHPYTRALLAAHPISDPKDRSPRLLLSGEVEDPSRGGCSFAGRCMHAEAECFARRPFLQGKNGHQAACFLLNGEV